MNLKHIIVTLSGFAILAVSCEKKLDEVYVNPNSPVRVPVETLLPGIIGNFNGSSAAAGSAYGTANDGINVARYVQYWGANTSANQYDQMGGATGASDVMGSVWAMHYFGQGENLNKMIEWSLEEQKYNYVGVGYAIRAWAWLTTTDMYGEIIVGEAFRKDQLTFKYDDQKVAYEAARTNARMALEYLNRTDGNGTVANLQLGDAFMNNGDINKWKKFAYAVLARSFHHLTNKAEYNADSVIYYANLAQQTNADNTYQRFAATGITGTSNYYGPFRSNMGTLRQSAYIVNLMTGANTQRFKAVTDPRIGYLLQTTPTGTYAGVTPGRGYGTLNTNNLRPKNFWGNGNDSTVAPLRQDSCRYIFRNEGLWPVFTAAEMQFMKAEALYRKNDKAGALAAYTQGVSLAIDMVATDFPQGVAPSKVITATSKAAYLASTEVIPAAASLTLSHIMLQKYIALYGWGALETWVDMRRFHYTDGETGTGYSVYADFLVPSGNDLYVNNAGKAVYRARPRYNSEYIYNIDELNRIGGVALDYHTKEQWFSQK